MAIVSDQSLAELIVKRHHGGGDLGDADQLRFDSWVGEQMWAFFHSWDRVQADSMESDLWIRPGLGGFLQLEGVWSSWEASRVQFPEPFQAEVERVREDLRRLGEGE
jgi:hypothetical protein